MTKYLTIGIYVVAKNSEHSDIDKIIQDMFGPLYCGKTVYSNTEEFHYIGAPIHRRQLDCQNYLDTLCEEMYGLLKGKCKLVEENIMDWNILENLDDVEKEWAESIELMKVNLPALD